MWKQWLHSMRSRFEDPSNPNPVLHLEGLGVGVYYLDFRVYELVFEVAPPPWIP